MGRWSVGRLIAAPVIGVVVTLLSTFVGERRAPAVYPDIMSCETGCSVVATGWPFVFVRDYLGMSVGNRADITEVWFAADRFDWLPFLANTLTWSLLTWWGLHAMRDFRQQAFRWRQQSPEVKG